MASSNAMPDVQVERDAGAPGLQQLDLDTCDKQEEGQAQKAALADGDGTNTPTTPATDVPGTGTTPTPTSQGKASPMYGRMTSQGGSATTTASGLMTSVKEGDSDNESRQHSPRSGSGLAGTSEAGTEAGTEEPETAVPPTPVAELAANGLPSIGSALHAAGECKRCCFYLKGRCHNGVNCQFCHLQHEKRSRGRGCRGHGTSGRGGEAATSGGGGAAAVAVVAAAAAAQQQQQQQQHAAALAMAGAVPRSPPGLDMPMAMLPSPHGPAPPGLAAPPRASPKGVPPCAPPAPPRLPPLGPPKELPQERNDVPPPPENSPSGLWTAGQLKVILPVATDLAGVNVTVPRSSLQADGTLLSTPAPTPRARAEAAGGQCAWGANVRATPQCPPPPGRPLGAAPGYFKGSPSMSPIFGTTPVPPGGEALPRLLGYTGRMCPVVGAMQKPVVAQHPAPGRRAVTPTAGALSAPAPPPIAAPLSGLAAKVGDAAAPAPVEGAKLMKEIDEQAAQGNRNRPAKVIMSDYTCSVPALDPQVPVKKRLPEWSL